MNIKVFVLTVCLLMLFAGIYGFWSFYSRPEPETGYILSDPGLTDRQFRSLIESPAIHRTLLDDSPIRIASALTQELLAIAPENAFRTRMHELGIPFVLQKYPIQPDGGDNLTKAIQKAISTNPDYLVVSVETERDQDNLIRLLADCPSKIFVVNKTVPITNWKRNAPYMYIGFDPSTGAKLIASEARNIFADEESVPYAIIYETPANRAIEIQTTVFIEELSDANKFQLVDEYYTQDTSQDAYQKALIILNRHPDLRFIHACSSKIAFSALKAIQDQGKEKQVLVNGWGGTKEEILSVKNGGLAFTVIKVMDDIGVALAEAIRLDRSGQTTMTPRAFSASYTVCRRGMSDEELQHLMAKAFRYSHAKDD